jgi:hypothetical protein
MQERIKTKPKQVNKKKKRRKMKIERWKNSLNENRKKQQKKEKQDIFRDGKRLKIFHVYWFSNTDEKKESNSKLFFSSECNIH